MIRLKDIKIEEIGGGLIYANMMKQCDLIIYLPYCGPITTGVMNTTEIQDIGSF